MVPVHVGAVKIVKTVVTAVKALRKKKDRVKLRKSF
jgi:hypothetical protein